MDTSSLVQYFCITIGHLILPNNPINFDGHCFMNKMRGWGLLGSLVRVFLNSSKGEQRVLNVKGWLPTYVVPLTKCRVAKDQWSKTLETIHCMLILPSDVSSYFWGHFMLVISLYTCDVTLFLWCQFILVRSLYACDITLSLWCHFILVLSIHTCEVTLFL